MEIQYLHEPDDLQCGQAVLAMLTGLPVSQVAEELKNERETNLREMKDFLRGHGFRISDERVPVREKEELPSLCLLSLETPRCWHWSLYCGGLFYDPEHGILRDFPNSNRRYYWEVKPEE